MLRRARGAGTATGPTRSPRRRVLVVLAAIAAGAAWIASSAAAPERASVTGDVITFHVVFSGSGNATSSYPPQPSNTTVFTTSISWNIAFDVQLTLGNVGSDAFQPGTGSTLAGVSNGVYEPGGLPIQPGCEQIDLLLDPVQTAATMPGGAGPTYEFDLFAPGFDGGALLAYRPIQCGNPFPGDASGPGCPDPVGYYEPAVHLDPTRAKETWPLSETCNIPDEGQTASWTATVTATRTSAGPGTEFVGHTRQKCSRWDNSCTPGARLPIAFEARGGAVEGLSVQDEGRCNHKLHSQDAIGGGFTPTPRAVRLGSGGVFTVRYTLHKGAFVATVKGVVGATGAHGVLSARGRYRRTRYGYEAARHGRIVCIAKRIHWTAAAAH
jgi:hypothetical protein